MANAIPRLATIDSNYTEGKFINQPDGPFASTEGRPPAAQLGNDSLLTYPFPYTSGYAPSYTTYPYTAVGKLFFSSGGLNYVCSGGVVQNYMIYTAGHCVFDLAVGAWTTNILFVPAYNNGPGLYGSYSSWQSWSRTEYTGSPAANPNRAYDIGIIILCKINGYGIGHYSGWFGAAWNYPYSQYWRSLGYPQAAPFNGLWDYYCDSGLGIQDTNYNPNTMGIGCDATGGCSGGPWVLGFGSGANQINSVNGYKYNNQPAALYGAYFGSAAQDLYNTAVAITPGC